MIIITGASKGIGKYLFNRFCDSDEMVCGTYFNTNPDEKDLGSFSKVNISDINEVEDWISSLQGNFHNIILLNCAGINYNSMAHKSNHKSWYNVINTNLIGTYNVIRTVLPFMRNDNYGRIINFSSIVAQIGVPGASAYAASKSGLWGLAKCIALENAQKGITINNLNLGYFDIGMINEIPLEFKETIRDRIPVGSFGDSRNIYNAVKFLIESEYVNGANIDINGALI